MWTTIMHEWRPSYSYLRNFQYRYGMTMREVPEQHISRGLWVSCGKIGKQSIETCWTRRWRMNDPCADHTLPPKICPACGFDMMWQGEAEVGWSQRTRGSCATLWWSMMIVWLSIIAGYSFRHEGDNERFYWGVAFSCFNNQGLAVTRYSSAMTEAMRNLYAQGGLPRFYRGIGPALVQARQEHRVIRLGQLGRSWQILAVWQYAEAMDKAENCKRCTDAPQI